MGTTFTYSEQELVSLLKGRDAKAFSYLYDNYSGALLGIISQIIEDMDMSNDVPKMIVTLLNLPVIQCTSHYHAWIYAPTTFS